MTEKLKNPWDEAWVILERMGELFTSCAVRRREKVSD
jgi:hypothetical protein